jgi:hypothetical protein
MGGEFGNGLGRCTSQESVENGFVFVADSVRTDFVPDVVTEIGVSAQAVAPSTFTASSVPSLLTGTYPAEHQVWDFDGLLSRADCSRRTSRRLAPMGRPKSRAHRPAS